MDILAIVIIGVAFILPGLWMYIKPPKKINPMVGYRTTRSMSSQEAWDFANKYSAVRIILGGIVYVFVNLVLLFLFRDTEWILISAAIIGTILIAIYVIADTEKQLKQKFPE